MAWPSDSQWFPLTQSYSPIHDPLSDAGGERNVVPDSGPLAAAYVYNDGVNSYFRIRLDDSPAGSGGQGLLRPFSWGFEIDTDQNADDYEWLIIINGLVRNELIELRENTIRSQLGDPSDKAEFVAAQYPVAGNYRILPADSCFNGPNLDGTCDGSNTDLDYFLDFKLPVAVLKAATGITDDTLIRYFVGSTSASNNLTESGADLVGGSTLYEGLSDYLTLSGTLPPGAIFYDGEIRFTEDIGGFGDRALAGLNETLYVRVDDLDLNSSVNPSGDVRVLLTSPTGDSEILILTATGVQGKYTGSIPTSATGNSDGTLYITDGQTATVTFLEAVSADLTQIVTRTDTILFTSSATDLGIVKTRTSSQIATVGDTAIFTVTVTNHGPNTKVNTVATDLLPIGLNYVSATFNPAQGSYNSGTGAWTLGSLSSGSSVTMTLTAIVAAGASGTITNTATLPTDGNPANDSDSASIFLGGTDLKLSKTVSNAVPVSGDAVTFTLNIINLGPNSTDSVTVTDLLPPGITFTGASPTQGIYNNLTGLWSVGTLASGSGAQLVIDTTVSGANGQIITNTASITNSTQPDINSANDSDSAALQVGYTDLTISKLAQKLSAPSGLPGTAIAANTNNTVEFTVTLTNNGPHTATNITVTDLTPAGMTFLSSTPSAGSYNSGTGLWTLASLSSGGTVTLTIQARINNGTAGQVLLNEAEITAVDQPDSVPGNEYATASVAVNGTDLQVIKSVSNATPSPGQNVTWTLTVTNNGPNPAAGIIITDLLPTGVTYVSDNPSVGSYDAGKQNSDYQWDGFVLDILGSATLQIVTSIDAGTEGENITNIGFLTSASVTDADESNNTGSASIAVSGTDLRITKTASPDYPNTGDTATYVLTAYNDGPNSAAGVVVSDLLPPEVTYDSHSGGTYDPVTGIWDVGTLLNGANSQLTILAIVRNEDNNLIITNTATISAPGVGDPDLSNNTAIADISIGATDLAISKTVSSPTPYPGETIDYTITISNLSGNQASGIELQDILPAGVTYASHVATRGSFAFGLWVVGNLDKTGDPNDSATLTITATVDIPTAGIPIGSTITNSATLWAIDQIDTNAANDTDSADIITTFAGDLSTSIKTVIDPNGGDILLGDYLRYSITLIETAGTTAYNARIDDDIPANVSNFTVISFPAGASNNSTGAGTGLNGNGYLDISGITVPANGSVTILFDVQVSGANGSTIANTATVTNDGGIGGVATAPTLTIGASSIPASGIKQLYLQSPDSENSPTIPQALSRLPVTAYPNPIRVRIREADTPVRWDLTPVLQAPLTLNANAQVILQIADEDATLHNLRLTLSYNAGAGSVLLAQQDFTNLNIANFIPVAYTFNLATPAITIPAGSTLELTVDNEPTNVGSRIYIFPFAAFSGTPDTSRVELNSATVINVDSIDLFDTGGAPIVGGVAPGTTVHIRSTVSDPFGSYDISAARITLTDPLGAVQVNAQPMSLYSDSLAATKTFEYIYAVPGFPALGNWTIRVDADEGSEGTISDYGLGVLPVTAPAPSITILKSADRSTVNSGENITYTILVQNSGTGAATIVEVYDALSPFVDMVLDFDTGTPPVEAFDFDPQTSGLTLGVPTYTFSGLDITRWDITMGGSFAASSQFSLRFKVQVK
jgi:uncharacterized repeat protein (TIGR01451 family)